MKDARILGLMAYISLAEQQRLAKDASLTPTVPMEIDLGEKSAQAWNNFEKLAQIAKEQNIDLATEMATYLGLMEQMEARLRPTDWYERLVKSFVTIGVLGDFNEHLHFFLSEETKAQLGQVDWYCAHSSWAVPHIEQACQTQPTVPSRLSLWGRRVVGDVISTLRQALSNYPDILGGEDPRGLENLTEKIRANHKQRMEQAGLKS